jgi:hypothetical protein
VGFSRISLFRMSMRTIGLSMVELLMCVDLVCSLFLC